MHHTMTVAAPARTAAHRRPAVAVKTDAKTGHDIAYVTRGHAAGCAGAMAYHTRTGDPPAFGKDAAPPRSAYPGPSRPPSRSGSNSRE